MSSRAPLEPDRGLQARMVASLGLLVGLYVVLIATLAALGLGAIAVAVIAAVVFLVQWFTCERLILSALHARPLTPGEVPELTVTLRELCDRAHLPLVGLAEVPSPVPDALTVGRSPAGATICLTRGLRERLGPDELEAVLAHELAHVASRDVAVMTLGSWFAALGAHLAAWHPRRAGTARSHRSPDGDPRVPSVAQEILSGLLCLVSFVILQAVSRDRQLVADRGAGALTGRPGAMRDALAVVSGELQALTARERMDLPGELIGLGLVPVDVPGSVASLLALHPPLGQRLDRLAGVREALA